MTDINHERLRDYLLDLVRIDSHSREEGRVAARVAADLRALGIEVTVDDAGEKVGGDTGNVIARVEGTDPGAPPLASDEAAERSRQACRQRNGVGGGERRRRRRRDDLE